MKRVLVAMGTRPEVIKLAPVIAAMRTDPRLETVVLATGQHREQLASALRSFSIQPTADLLVMQDRQSLPSLIARLIEAASTAIRDLQPEYLVVQGDTVSTFCLALAAFLASVPVGHVEAGLRSGSIREPFPEEGSRRLTAVLTDLDFAPTPLARSNLMREGKDPDHVLVTGQTGVDTIVGASLRGKVPEELRNRQLVTVTLHRRENWDSLPEIAATLRRLAEKHPEFLFVFPMHLNPVVREAVVPILSATPNFYLREPMDYETMAATLAKSVMILTDSGGLQEEGVSLDVPVVVVRNVTERPEGVASGKILIGGTEPEALFTKVTSLLAQPEALRAMKRGPNPYGDGHAGGRIAQAIGWRLNGGTRPADWTPESN